jgi:hypothetical protein
MQHAPGAGLLPVMPELVPFAKPYAGDDRLQQTQ